MEISCLGHSSFKLRSRMAVLVTDPYDSEMVGLKFPKVEADIVTVSHDHSDHNAIQAVEGEPVIVAGPGEYEIKGVKIIGINSYHDKTSGGERGANTIYRINMDGINIVHLGDLGHKLDEKTQETLDDVDILMLPVGEGNSISLSDASEIISQLEPKIIIPMHYFRVELNQKIFSALTKLDAFLKEQGKENLKPETKLVITKDKLPLEPIVAVLE